MGKIKRYAGHRLYAKNEEYPKACIVEIDVETHLFQRCIPLNGIEHPATEWLGGSFILSPIKQIEYAPPYKTLDEIVDFLLDSGNSGNTFPVESPTQFYVWHTPTTQSGEIVENILRL